MNHVHCDTDGCGTHEARPGPMPPGWLPVWSEPRKCMLHLCPEHSGLAMTYLVERKRPIGKVHATPARDGQGEVLWRAKGEL